MPFPVALVAGHIFLTCAARLAVVVSVGSGVVVGGLGA